ncbi:hypothetical protein Y032_0179g725 [Ancylostoma ceylanicum]|uniref:Uncharacterized protein n=1 Tax=Ancylostoma ceylanicum TaxID=53326 RepID=A0A016SSP9_9BILA|nr:hypothetical protein Y032_0179g725 [Ancylostoma ceylanicum]
MARPLSWFLTPLSILKVCELVCLLLVIVFFIDGRIQWGAYSVIYALAFLLAFGCVLTLLIHYFEVPKASNQLPWLQIESGGFDENQNGDIIEMCGCADSQSVMLHLVKSVRASPTVIASCRSILVGNFVYV